MNLTKKLFIGACAATLAASTASPFAPTNFFAPYDPNYSLYKVPRTDFRFGAQAEFGSTSKAENWDGKSKNVLKIHNDHEDIAATFFGARQALLVPYTNNPLQPLNRDVATVDFDGSFDQFDITLFTDYKIPVNIFDGHTQFSLYVPIRQVRVKDVRYTAMALPANSNNPTTQFYNDWVRTLDALKAQIATIDNSMDLNGWSKTSAGDLVAMLKWGRKFRQDKGALKNVYLYFKGGVSIPTGTQHDVNKVFSMPLGNDGAVGIPFGLGIGLNTKYKIKLGADAEFLVLFDHTDDYRMKTALNQTEFLLLDKGRATKDHGLTWKFNLYAKGVHLWQGFSLKAAYEYLKHDADSLTSKSNNFDNSIINSANSLKEWNTHNIIFMLNWDSYKVNKKMVAKPQFSLFYKLPVGGKRVVNAHTFGGQLALNF